MIDHSVSNETIIKRICGDSIAPEKNWMPASQTRLIKEPALLWLDKYGEKNGFSKDIISDYDLLRRMIFPNGNAFEKKWVDEILPDSSVVCGYPWEVKEIAKVRKTVDLMLDGSDSIYQGALWNANQKIHGVPDIIINSHKFNELFPGLLSTEMLDINAPELERGFYLPLDLKFTSKLESKHADLKIYSLQLRQYAFMIGEIQGFHPPFGYLITRDRLSDPLPIPILTQYGEDLDRDLSEVCKRYQEIVEHGDDYRPWTHDLVRYDLKNNNDTPWSSAKIEMAKNHYEGGDPTLLPELNNNMKVQLNELGMGTLEEIMGQDSSNLPLETIKGIGEIKARNIRAIIDAQSSDFQLRFNHDVLPAKKKNEFFIDYEYFTNIHVDFENQWPDLEGCEMVFMIGVGYIDNGEFKFEQFTARLESHASELQIINEFTRFIEERFGADLSDDDTSFYHWSNAEVWQTAKMAQRHNLDPNHLFNRMPFIDLQKIMKLNGIVFPGSRSFSIKDMAKALSGYKPKFRTEWPDELAVGSDAMVMGWEAYKKDMPLDSYEMGMIQKYLQIDCLAIWNILSAMRHFIDIDQ